MKKNGLYIDEKTSTLFIDVIPLLDYNKLYSNHEVEIIKQLNKFKESVDISEICLFIGRNFTISMFEKEMNLVTSLINFFYNSGLNIIKCDIYHIPSSFSTMFSVVKPLISSSALKIIYFENKTYEEWNNENRSSQYSLFS